MSLLYIGRIDKLEIGLTAVINTDITNVILMNWERNHDVRPRLYANLKYPTSFQQPHSWILGSFSLLSDNHTAIYATDVQAAAGNQYAMYDDADSNVIDFFQVTYQDEDGNPRVTRFFHPIIYRYNKELLNYDDSTWIYHFLAGYAVEGTGAAPPEEEYLVSADEVDDSIFVHHRITSIVTTSFSTPASNPQGLTNDGSGNLISVDSVTRSIYIHNGITGTITTSFSHPGPSPNGAAVTSAGNLVTSDPNYESIYIHSGITSTITTSFSHPGTQVMDISIDSSGNLVSVVQARHSVYIHNGITATITTSFSTGGGAGVSSLTGLTLDSADNLILGDEGIPETIYIHDGITSTVTTSFSSPQHYPTGLTVVGG